jgi:ABC-type transport system involved in multi-copper enzyme maturation permease subunit
MMPFLAILRHDLRTLLGSWLVRTWLVAAILLTLVIAAVGWHRAPSAPLIASLLFPYLVFPWFVVVMVLGINPTTGARADSLCDGFLCRPINRYEYLLAVWAARVVAVLLNYLLVIVPAIAIVALANRPVDLDRLTWYGTLAAIAVVALVLVFQVSLAFLAGTLLRRSPLAIVVLLFLWYPVNMLLDTFHLEAFSPLTLSRVMPTLLRQPWRPGDLASGRAAADAQLEEATRQAADFWTTLSGTPSAPPPEPTRKPGFFERDESREFSLAKVLLGYGLPTLVATALATFCFCRRDL